jgi:hypothetical protein
LRGALLLRRERGRWVNSDDGDQLRPRLRNSTTVRLSA